MSRAVLYVDDDRPNLDVFCRTFDERFRVLVAEGADAALAVVEREEIGVVVTDHRMPGMTGVELLEVVQKRRPEASRILLTAYSNRELLLDAIRRGHVHDYVLKPWDVDDLELRLTHAMSRFDRQRELLRASIEREALREEMKDRGLGGPMLGLEGDLAPLASVLDRVAPTDSTIAIFGETGVGKELLAREVHERSARREGPFVRVNCSALAEGVLESELFGHEAGAFTGARTRRVGRFEQANGGTLFLDEIGDLSPTVQVKLLRVLQEREIERVGSNQAIRIDVRVIAATHRDLAAMSRDGGFRSDLFHRLVVVPLIVPPLRERPNDLGPLARSFLERCAGRLGKRLALADETISHLARYDWPGNVRELHNIIERAVVLAEPDATLYPEDLIFDFCLGRRSAPWGSALLADSPVRGSPAPASPDSISPGPDSPDSVFAEIAARETAQVREALRQARGSRAGAARILGIPRTTLNDRIRRLGIG